MRPFRRTRPTDRSLTGSPSCGGSVVKTTYSLRCLHGSSEIIGHKDGAPSVLGGSSPSLLSSALPPRARCGLGSLEADRWHRAHQVMQFHLLLPNLPWLPMSSKGTQLLLGFRALGIRPPPSVHLPLPSSWVLPSSRACLPTPTPPPLPTPPHLTPPALHFLRASQP